MPMKMKIGFVFSILMFFPPALAAGAVEYTKFSHSTPKHTSAYNTCHTPQTKHGTNVAHFLDVPDFPVTDVCVSCRRAQFFRGARQPICSVCHSKTSPRDDVRYAFRNPPSRLQFLIEFPHD